VLEEELGGTIFYQTELVRMLQDSAGRVTGVAARGPDGCLVEFRAPQTVLACGGFEGNPEMLTQYMGKIAVDLKLIAPGVAFNRGAGIRAAMEIGAGTAGQFDWMHAELVDARSTRADAVIYPHNYGILVNEEAKRFHDEAIGPHLDYQEVLAREIWLNQNQTAFFIADGHIRGNPVIEARFDTDHPAIVADTIADLADQLGLDAEQLEKTIADYNAATSDDVAFDLNRVDGKSTNGLEPPKSNWAYPLDRPPYFAYPVTAAIVFTCGGLKVNPDAQVVTANGVPIPGLYAAGEITGLYYHQYQAGTSVLRGLTFGRVAGEHVARAQEAATA
jgi:tricarballylate dehydrogenase